MQETSATVRKFCKLLLKVATYESLLCSGKKNRKNFCAKKNFFSVPVKTKQIIKNRDTTLKVNTPKDLPARGGGTLTLLNAMLVMGTTV